MASQTLLSLVARLQQVMSVTQGRALLLDYARKSCGARLALLFELDYERQMLRLLDAHIGETSLPWVRFTGLILIAYAMGYHVAGWTGQRTYMRASVVLRVFSLVVLGAFVLLDWLPKAWLAVGLADFGKPSGYLERQVRRWGSQWELVRLPEDRRDADVERLHRGLHQSIPQQSRTSIVHGDYRIDNTILDADDPTKVRAVVDWELSTLGDPLSDAALMCVYRDPALDLIVNAQAAWTSPLPTT